MDAEEKIKEYEAQLLLTGGAGDLLNKSQEAAPAKSKKPPPPSLAAAANKDEDSGPITGGAEESAATPAYTKLLRRSKRYYEQGDAVKRVVGMNRIEDQFALNVEWIGHRKRSWMLAATLVRAALAPRPSPRCLVCPSQRVLCALGGEGPEHAHPLLRVQDQVSTRSGRGLLLARSAPLPSRVPL